MSDPQQPEKKIIIDEDWKTKVETERAAEEGAGGTADTAAPSAENSPGEPAPELPPPSLIWLASTLYFQGAMSLGMLPNPVSGKTETNLPQARHAIDTLEMLQQKTEGNRAPDESEDLEAMLYQLRMAFVARSGG